MRVDQFIDVVSLDDEMLCLATPIEDYRYKPLTTESLGSFIAELVGFARSGAELKMLR